MWNEIVTQDDLTYFLERVYYFHDSIIKEIKYISGAFVNSDLWMHPVNEIRSLKMIVQTQVEDLSAIEMEFQALNWFHLVPNDDNYTCEILDATMILKTECIYWCDLGSLSEEELISHPGTVICAKKMRWRLIENGLGEEELYVPKR